MRLIGWGLVYTVVIAGAILIAHGCSKAVTTMVEGSSYERQVCYILDAGHGGIDTGATSCSGIPESKINLEITIRLRDLLHLMGYETTMIRTTDTSIYTQGDTIAQQKVSGLKNRVAIVNDTPNGVLVSIHQNTFPSARYRGPQVFYAGAEGSKELAEILQSAMNEHLRPETKRGCKAAKGIYLMEKTNRTGVLIECGFLSNPQEDQLLQQPHYQQLLSAVIAVTIIKQPLSAC